MVMVNDKLLSFGEIDEFGTLLVVVVETWERERNEGVALLIFQHANESGERASEVIT
jgi:hypothetical protein